MLKRWWLFLLGAALSLLATYPAFFDSYRAAAFKSVPYDDYAPYLLVLLGEGGELPGAPFVYRVFSVMVAVPFYYILPVYSFTNLQGIDVHYLKATQAIVFSSYVFMLLNAVAIFWLAKNRYGSSSASAMIVALLSAFCLSAFVSRTGVDLFAIFTASLLLISERKKWFFISLMVVSVAINEKISLMFCAIFSARYLWSLACRQSFREYWQLMTSVFAVALYFSIISYLQYPGNEAQTNPAAFGKAVVASLAISATLKGLVLNVLPVMLLSVFVWMAVCERAHNGFRLIDISGMLALLGLALLAGVVFNIGRIVMYSYPLYLPAAACFMDRVWGSLPTARMD